MIQLFFFLFSELVAVTHIHLDLNVNFKDTKLQGRADLTINRHSQETTQLVRVFISRFNNRSYSLFKVVLLSLILIIVSFCDICIPGSWLKGFINH